MPLECRKDMTWGPRVASVQLRGGDEVPLPVKKVLIQSGHVVKVDKVAGKPWSKQPEAAQNAWAECNGMSFLSTKDNHTGETTVVEVKTHGTRMVADEESAPSSTKRRERSSYVQPKEVKNEAPGPALSESQEVAGGEGLPDESAPPIEAVDVEGTGLLEDKKPEKTIKKKRGRPRKK